MIIFSTLVILVIGVPRILESYGKECFKFMDNFTRMTFPASEKVTEQVTEQVLKLLSKVDQNEYSTTELMNLADIKHRPTFYITICSQHLMQN